MFKQVSNDTIYRIYNNINVSKYDKLPSCPIKTWNNSWVGKDLPRVFCILDFKDWINKYNIHNIDYLGCTDQTDPELEFLNYKNMDVLKYPPNDLHSINIKDKYDFFMFNQTIEHLYNPFQSVLNIYNAVKPGGYVFTSVPTLNIPHMMPFHFNGYTPVGLASLFISCGFEVLEVGQWGNYDYISKLFKYHQWPDVSNCSIANEKAQPCQCWALVKRI